MYRRRAQQLKQKSRVKWEIEGDSNTKFFHRVIQRRMRGNHIQGIRENDLVITDPDKIKMIFLNHFQRFFREKESELLCSLNSCFVDEGLAKDRTWLERPFCMEEISVALSEMELTKAQGPDGFNAGWIKKLWPQIKDQVFVFFSRILQKCKHPQGSKLFVFCLNPKNKNP